MSIITSDDIIDVYQKLSQRGLKFILSKFSLNEKSRTLSAFNDTAFDSSNWWLIPQVKQRWNEKISGNKNIEYEQFLATNFLNNRTGLKMLSLGSGVCSHELKFAMTPIFEKIVCVDIAANLLEKGKQVAQANNLSNIEFLAGSVYELDIEEGAYDVVLFHSSLHHFSNIQDLVSNQVKAWLKPSGLLVINEYVGPNRLQFDKEQISYVNKGLAKIPLAYRKRFKSGFSKKSFSGSGLIRMILADPSECIESQNILPTIRNNFKVLAEKPYGGNLLMNILKDIAHNFMIDEDKKADSILKELFDLEDEYLKSHQSDFVFGVYENKQ